LHKLTRSVEKLEQHPNPDVYVLNLGNRAPLLTMFQRVVALELCSSTADRKSALRKCTQGMDAAQMRLFEKRPDLCGSDIAVWASVVKILQDQDLSFNSVLTLTRAKLLTRMFLAAMHVGYMSMALCVAEKVPKDATSDFKKRLCTPIAAQFAALVESALSEMMRQMEASALRGIKSTLKLITSDLTPERLQTMAQMLRGVQ
jgi:hypothetical protein